MCLHVDADKGLLLLTAVPYDETIVEAIRTLPQRRYRPDAQDWIVPARHEQLRALASVIAELSEDRINVALSAAATARLAGIDVGWAMLRDGEIHIAGPYSQRRLAALRALPERRFDPDSKAWVLPLTRAGALAVLALGNSTELVISERASRALQRTATATANAPTTNPGKDHAPGPERRSPVAHWRHFTSGPVFDNPARPRLRVPGIGLCVRVRVDPQRKPATGRAEEHP